MNGVDPASLITAFGVFGILLIIFAETGLLIGFFLPGDTLLFSAGLFTTVAGAESVGIERLSLPTLLIMAPIFAIAGAQFGHYLGDRYGRRFFERPNSRLFRREHVDKAEHYFNKFGPAKAVVLARFIPIVRTFLNPLAGMLEMSARRFFVWNVIGAIIWTDSFLLLGHYLGNQVEGIDQYVLPVIVVAVIVTVAPVLRELFRRRRSGGNNPEKNDSEASRPSLSGDSSR
ncbi:DedA family protein [Actinomadura alba]